MLIDAIGALVSTFLLGVVFVMLEDFIGMPLGVLYLLASVAMIFAFYSFSCHLFVQNISKRLILIITLANLAYCCVTAFLVIYFFEQLTSLGVLYFAGEIFLIAGLVSIVLKTATGLPKK